MLETPKDDATTKVKSASYVPMDNQQATPAEIGYLAAMLEGEGTISLNVRKKRATKRNGTQGVDISLNIANTDPAIVQKCAAIIRSFGIEPYIHCYERKGGWKDCWHVVISRISSAAKLLPVLIPHLAGHKKHKAELVLSFLERRLSRTTARARKSGPVWYDEEDWNIVRKIYEHDGKDLSLKVPRDYTPPAELVRVQ